MNKDDLTPLQRAVYDQIGVNNLKKFAMYLKIALDCGASCGIISGFASYTDAVKFAEENYDLILEFLKEQAEAFGYNDYLDFMKTFYHLQNIDKVDIKESFDDKNAKYYKQVYSAIAWCVVDQVAYDLEEEIEEWLEEEDYRKLFMRS